MLNTPQWELGRGGEVGKDVSDPKPPCDYPLSPTPTPPAVFTPTDTDSTALLCYVTKSSFQHVRLKRHLLGISLLEPIPIRLWVLLGHTVYKQIASSAHSPNI